MSEQNSMNQKALVLPPSIITRVDLSRLISEIELVDNELISKAAREKSNIIGGTEIVYSEQLNDFLSINNIEISEDSVQRIKLLSELQRLKKNAPMVHVTFASAVDNESLQKIVAWLRNSIHSHVLVRIGLQPALIGGVYIRTANKVFDFSMRAKLANHRDIITREVEALRAGK